MSELSNETTFMQKKSFLTILEPQTCFWIFAIFGQNLELFFKQRFCKRLNFFFFSEFENRTSQLLPVFSLVKKYLKLAAVRPKEDRSQNRPILGHFRTNSTFSNRQAYSFCRKKTNFPKWTKYIIILNYFKITLKSVAIILETR